MSGLDRIKYMCTTFDLDYVELTKAVKELYYWQHGDNRSNFSSFLYLIMQKADADNYNKIKKGFPEEAFAFELWNKADNYGEDLFKLFGFKKS